MRTAICLLLLGALVAAPAADQSPAEAKLMKSAGVSIRYVHTGGGEPVLLIHGFGGRLEFWHGAGIAAALTTAGFAVVAYDSRGHGESGKPYDPAQYIDEDVNDAIRLLDHLSIDRAHVVGYSRGAEIASRAVTQYPDRFRSVVLGGWGIDNPVDTLSREDCLATAELLAQGAFPRPLIRALLPPGAPLPTPDEQLALARQLGTGNDTRALAAAFQAGCDARPMTAATLGQSGVPALAIVGDLDGMRPAVQAMGNDMGSAIQVVMIEGADHFTAPGHPEFAARLVSFLGEVRD